MFVTVVNILFLVVHVLTTTPFQGLTTPRLPVSSESDHGWVIWPMILGFVP